MTPDSPHSAGVCYQVPMAKGGLATSPGSGRGAKLLTCILGLPGSCCPRLQLEEATGKPSPVPSLEAIRIGIP